MRYDKPLIALLIGAISTIPYEIFTRIMVFLGIGKYSLYELDSLVVTLFRPSLIMGIIVSFLTGGLFVVLFYYALKKMGSDYLIPKTIIASALIWLTLEVFFMLAVEGRLIKPRPVNDYFSHFFGSITYGITVGLLFKRFLQRITAP